MSVPLDVGLRIRRLRLAAGCTQKELAAAAGYNIITLNGWELGRHWPSPDAIRAVAVALGIRPEDIVDGEW